MTTSSLVVARVGATLASLGLVQWSGVVGSVLIPMVVSPLVGFSLAFAVMIGVQWAFRRSQPSKVNRRFRIAQTVSAAAMALGHGLQDAQKTMGVITLALVVGGYQSGFQVQWWVIEIGRKSTRLNSS